VERRVENYLPFRLDCHIFKCQHYQAILAFDLFNNLHFNLLLKHQNTLNVISLNFFFAKFYFIDLTVVEIYFGMSFDSLNSNFSGMLLCSEIKVFN
jgi:hypothetical protein